MSATGVEWGETGANERIDVDLDPEPRRAAARVNRWSRWTRLAVRALAYVAPIYLVVRVYGSLLPLIGWVLLLGVAHGQVLETEQRVTLVTEKPPDAVRAEFGSLVNPITAALLQDAVAVQERDGEDDLSVALVFERWFRHPYVLPMGISETADGDVRIRLGPEAAADVTTVSVEPTAEGSRVIASGTHSIAPIDLPALWIEGSVEAPLLSSLGYERVETIADTRLVL